MKESSQKFERDEGATLTQKPLSRQPVWKLAQDLNIRKRLLISRHFREVIQLNRLLGWPGCAVREALAWARSHLARSASSSIAFSWAART